MVFSHQLSVWAYDFQSILAVQQKTNMDLGNRWVYKCDRWPLSLKVCSLVKKEKQYREPMCCWTGISVRKLLFSAKCLNVDHAWMYANEVDAVKLESRGLFTVGVNLNMAEYWDSWIVVFPPKMLVVGIVVPERGIKS